MDNNFNQQPVYQQAPKQPSNTNMMALIALACSAFGAFMAILGATLTCSCSAGKSFEKGSEGYSLSAVFIVAILGAIIAIAGVVLGIVASKQGETKLSMVAIILGIFATMYALIPTFTICGYNCSLQNAAEDMSSQEFDYDDFDFGF